MVRTRVHLDMRRASNNIDTFNRRKSKLVARGVDPRTIAADYQVRKVYLHKNQETKTSELYYLNTLGNPCVTQTQTIQASPIVSKYSSLLNLAFLAESK